MNKDRESEWSFSKENEALERLNTRIDSHNTRLCVGLDIHPELGKPFHPKVVAISNVQIVEQTAEHAAAFKFQFAGYASQGYEGVWALEKSIKHIQEEHSDIPIILDGKFGDVDVSSEYYAQLAFNRLKVDAITVNPYVGTDGLEPFFSRENKLIYYVCLTSNPGSQDFQNIKTAAGTTVSEEVAFYANHMWNSRNNAGVVVGATVKAGQVARIRKLAPDIPFLMPGLGAQGADLSETYDRNSIYNVSRGILLSENPEKTAEAYKREINFAPKMRVIKSLEKVGAIQRGEFILVSGEKSNTYIDIRRLINNSKSLVEISSLMLGLAANSDYSVLAAVPTGAMPLTTAMSIESNKPMVYVRSSAKNYGTKSLVEGGVDVKGKEVTVVEDVITSGESVAKVKIILEEAGAIVKSIVVVVDRRENNKDILGTKVHSLLTLEDLKTYYALAI